MAIEMHLTGIKVTSNGNKVRISIGGTRRESWEFTPNQARIIALAINASADEAEEHG